jgi:DNA-binding transcriptional ArsR family regulator
MLDNLSSTFAALADPTRREILIKLSTGDAPVKELAQPFNMSLPAISRHLKVLENAGLISKHVEAQKRRCHLEAEVLREAGEWISQYAKFWTDSFEALDNYLSTLQSPPSDTKN